MVPNEASGQALGNIISIDHDAFSTVNSNYTLEINSSFLYQMMLRDSLYSKNLVDHFDFFADTIFLPGFVQYDDAGVSNMITPYSIMAGSKAYMYLNEQIYLSLKGYIGTEFIPDYNYMYNMVYGILLSGNVKQGDAVMGLSAGSSDFKNMTYEESLLYHFKAADILAAIAQDGNYMILKAGIIVPVTGTFSLMAGFNYTLEYNGWNASGGMEFRKIHLFSTDSRIACSVSFNPSGWFSFNLSWAVELPK
jgi:hypothetical protein